MIYSEKGNPWEFNTVYKLNSCKIEYKHIYNFVKEGPVIGQMYVNDVLVNCPTKYDGFGGPPLITQDTIYAPIYQKNILGFKDIMGAYVAEINIRNLSVKVIGKKHELIDIVYIENDMLYYFDSSEKNKNNIKYFKISDGIKPFTFWDKLLYLYDFIKNA